MDKRLTDWEQLSYEDKNHELFNKQVSLLKHSWNEELFHKHNMIRAFTI